MDHNLRYTITLYLPQNFISFFTKNMFVSCSNVTLRWGFGVPYFGTVM